MQYIDHRVLALKYLKMTSEHGLLEIDNCAWSSSSEGLKINRGAQALINVCHENLHMKFLCSQGDPVLGIKL